MMKTAARILSLIILVTLAGLYTGCGPDNDPEKSETDVQIEKLNGTWNANDGATTFNGGQPDLNHDNLVLTISGSAGNQSVSYTVSGRPAGPSAWPPNGTFAFGSSNVTTSLTRDDGVAISYSVTETALTIDFDFNLTPYTSSGRTETVDGQWHFVFTKQ